MAKTTTKTTPPPAVVTGYCPACRVAYPLTHVRRVVVRHWRESGGPHRREFVCPGSGQAPECACMVENPGDGFGERVVTHSGRCHLHPEYDEADA